MMNDYQPGRQFLQIPGPTNIPERVLRAMHRPALDQRGPEFQRLAKDLLERVKVVFKTEAPVVMTPSTGTGAWEAALVNTLSPGDRVLMFETGQFSNLWHEMALALGLKAELVPSNWRVGPDPARLEEILSGDGERTIKAVCIVHNETASGVTSRLAELRAAMDRAQHPALLMVDTISSLASIDYRHDEWRVDVTVGGSQKGLMLPAGMSFNVIGPRAEAAMATARLARSYFDWRPMLAMNRDGFFPYTPALHLMYGLDEALRMLEEEGLERVFQRHRRVADLTRAAVRGWGLELVSTHPLEHSDTVSAIYLPEGFDADRFRALCLERFNLVLGAGLGRLKGRVFRIGHLGDLSDLTVMGTLAGVEMGLRLFGVPLAGSGIAAAMAETTGSAASSKPALAA